MKIRTSINRHIVDKATNNQMWNFTNRFQNVELSLEDFLKKEILKGHSYCTSLLEENADGFCTKKNKFFKGGLIISVDIDNKSGDKKLTDDEGYWSFDDALQDPELKEYAAFIYTTASHTEDHHRFRIVFALHELMQDKVIFKKLITVLIDRFDGDTATVAVSQGFYGSKDAESHIWENVLSEENINELLIEYELMNTKVYQELSKEGIDDKKSSSSMNSDFSKMIKCLFEKGKRPNKEWFEIISILKLYSGLSDENIKTEVTKYVEWGDGDTLLQNAHKYKKLHLYKLLAYATKTGYIIPDYMRGEKFKKKFWYYKTTKNQNGGILSQILKFSYEKFLQLLINLGFRAYRQNNDIKFIRINEDKQIKIVIEHEIRLAIMKYLKDNEDLYVDSTDRIKVIDKFTMDSATLFRRALSLLPIVNHEIDEKLLRDTGGYIYFYFLNGYLEISKDNMELRDYSDLKDGYIWKSSVLEKNFTMPDRKESEYETFVKCICTNRGDDENNLEFNEDKYSTARSSLGYLLSRYKKETDARALILTDETTSVLSDGGRGKSTFNKSLSHIRNVVELEGPTIDFNNKFAFSDVDESTEIINIDDCEESFKFQKIYHKITGDFKVEGKNKDSFKIPFHRSPKMCLSTNHTFAGDGASDNRRRIIIEFSNYYNKLYTPEDMFGHMLFSGWDEIEWNRFYKYMAENAQYYLRDGIVEYTPTNLRYKSLQKETSDDLAEYFTEFLDPGVIYIARDVINDFEDIYKTSITPTAMTQALRCFTENYLSMKFEKQHEKHFHCKIYAIIENKKHNLKYLKSQETYKRLCLGGNTLPSRMKD